jgi:cytochrome P450
MHSDTSLHNQRSEHVLSHALNTILAWHSFWDPRMLLNPLRPIVQWYYGNVIYSFVRTELQNRFEEIKTERASSARGPRRAKSVATLAIEDYISQKELDTAHLDEKFIRITANQIRLFLFAGNDTTSSTIVYMFHFLSKNPHALTKLQEEHDLIFGSGTDAATKLRETPVLLNQCKYTLAVIKETLRLCPPSDSLRQGRVGATLTDKQGNVYPTDGLKVTIMHRFVHRHPRYWPRPEEFLPERWLPTVKPGDELYVAPNTGAYRPFEQGPRNCIGQTLVLNELRVVLIMTARKFVITPAYDEWDAAQLKNKGLVQKFTQWLSGDRKRSKTALGERAYQTSKAGGHPADGYPCRVSLAE